jgi:hypothetical protein
VLDKDCPNPRLFLKNRNKISITRIVLKEYLEKDLKIIRGDTHGPLRKIRK